MARKRTRALFAGGAMALGAAAVLTGTAPAGDTPARAGQEGVSGRFSAVMMIHTSSSSFGDLPGVNPWGGQRRTNDRFTYRSIPCTGNAPVNNISSDLPSYNTRVSGSRVPSSMRAHPFTFKIKRYRGGKRRMIGRITFTVCQLMPGATPANDPVPDENKPKIHVRFKAKFRNMTEESARFHGRFRLTGGTQRYEDLRGGGRIAGYFLCFNPAGCAQLGGNYLDGQFVMHGTYRDPSPDLAAE